MRPEAEIAIDEALIRDLLRTQHPDLAHLALTSVGEGWDNRLFRLGEDLVVRMPRRAVAASLIKNEQRWLPSLAAGLPLPVPAPRRAGRPGCGYPWPWSITSWLPGRPALLTPPDDAAAAGVLLGRFLRGLHRPAPVDAPSNPWRGVPLAARDPMLRSHLEQAGDRVDCRAVLDLWQRARSTPPWSGPPLWIHGDLHPGNLLVHEGRLSAVIDFGDLTAGDPATDLSVMWMLLPTAARPVFVAAARGEFNRLDDHTLARARGWALALGLAYMSGAEGDSSMSALGLTTVKAALDS